MDALKLMTEGMLKEQPPVIEIGDTVNVHVKIREGEKERIQAIEGTVIARKGGGVAETLNVWGIQIDITASNEVYVPPYKGVQKYEYARESAQDRVEAKS